MKPVEQTRTEIGFGNCMQACLASIFELPIEDIPDWNKNGGKNWGTLYDDWLAEYGLAMMSVCVTSETYRKCPRHQDVYYLGGFSSPRFKGLHSVVMKNYQVVWDPHPRRDMRLGEPFDVTFFVPLLLPSFIPRRAEENLARD